MRIQIAQRLRPFSHVPGTPFLLPDTSLRLRVYPTRVIADDLSSAMLREVGSCVLALPGPVEKFTVIQDLEKREICVFGQTAHGFMHYHIRGFQSQKAHIKIDKLPVGKEALSFAGEALQIYQEPMLTEDRVPFERLSLGNHKAQDWELIRRRADFAEIFPLWYALGQMVTGGPAQPEKGTLLGACQEALAAGHPETILPAFKQLWLAGFEGGLSSRLEDSDFHGMMLPITSKTCSRPLYLLTEGYRLIRQLFLQQQWGEMQLLPALPPAFHCGRMLNLRCSQEGVLQLEWTKKALRRLIFSASSSGARAFHFSRGEKSCRVRSSAKDPGKEYCSGQLIEMTAGTTYWFDRFRQ